MSYSRKSLLTVALICFCIISVQAQLSSKVSPRSGEKYKYKFNGIIIKEGGDTLDVKIKRGWKSLNKDKVTYNTAQGAKLITEGPNDIVAFSHETDSYRSTEVNGKYVFLKTNIVGIVNLYETVDDKGNSLFYLKRGNEDFQLVDRENYKTFLADYFKDCQSTDMTKALNKTTYTSFRISNLVSQYNACKDPSKYVAAKYKAKTRIEVYAIAGLGNFNYTFNFVGSLSNGSDPSGERLAPFLGVEALFTGDKKVSYGIGLAYTAYEFDLEDGPSNSAPIQFETSRFKITPFIRYSISENFNLAVRAGISYELIEFDAPNDANLGIRITSIQANGGFFGLDYGISRKFGVQADYHFLTGDAIFFGQEDLTANNLRFGLRYKLN